MLARSQLDDILFLSFYLGTQLRNTPPIPQCPTLLSARLRTRITQKGQRLRSRGHTAYKARGPAPCPLDQRTAPPGRFPFPSGRPSIACGLDLSRSKRFHVAQSQTSLKANGPMQPAASSYQPQRPGLHLKIPNRLPATSCDVSPESRLQPPDAASWRRSWPDVEFLHSAEARKPASLLHEERLPCPVAPPHWKTVKAAARNTRRCAVVCVSTACQLECCDLTGEEPSISQVADGHSASKPLTSCFLFPSCREPTLVKGILETGLRHILACTSWAPHRHTRGC